MALSCKLSDDQIRTCVFADMTGHTQDYCSDQQIAAWKSELLTRMREEARCLDPVCKVGDMTIDRQKVLQSLWELFQNLESLCGSKNQKHAVHCVSNGARHCSPYARGRYNCIDFCGCRLSDVHDKYFCGGNCQTTTTTTNNSCCTSASGCHASCNCNCSNCTNTQAECPDDDDASPAP